MAAIEASKKTCGWENYSAHLESYRIQFKTTATVRVWYISLRITYITSGESTLMWGIAGYTVGCTGKDYWFDQNQYKKESWKNPADMMTKTIPMEKFRASLNFIKIFQRYGGGWALGKEPCEVTKGGKLICWCGDQFLQMTHGMECESSRDCWYFRCLTFIGEDYTIRWRDSNLFSSQKCAQNMYRLKLSKA